MSTNVSEKLDLCTSKLDLIKQNLDLNFLNQTLTVMVSKEAYDHKPSRKNEIPKIDFKIKNLTIKDYITSIMQGHTCAHIFQHYDNGILPIKYKLLSTYRGTNAIVLDMDYMKHDMGYYNRVLTYKPTFMYYTFSHNEEEFNDNTKETIIPIKIRAVYVCDKEVWGAENYYKLYNIIANKFHEDTNEEVDNHMKSPAQCYHGTNGIKHQDVIINNIIYSPININDKDVFDFVYPDDEDDFLFEITNGKSGYNGIISKNIYYEGEIVSNEIYNYKLNTILISNNTISKSVKYNPSNLTSFLKKQLKANDHKYIPLFKDYGFWSFYFSNVRITNNMFLDVNDEKSVGCFMSHFYDKYPIVIESIVDYPEIEKDKAMGFVRLDENYKKIKIEFFKRKVGDKTISEVKKYADKSGRRNRLYNIGKQAKEINPEISLEQMVTTLVYFFSRIIINDGNEITKYIILQKAIEAYQTEITQTNFEKNTKKFETIKKWCIKNNTTKQIHKCVVAKYLRDEKIGELFDLNLSFAENHKILCENGINYSLRKVRSFAKEHFTDDEYNKMKSLAGRKPKAQN